MIRKDYIQRYFDELAKVLAAVLQLKNDLKPTEAEAKLNDFSTDYLGITLDEILEQGSDHVVNFLIQEKEFTLTHFKLLEDVFYHKYLINPSESILKNHTLKVLKHLTQNDKDFSVERAKRIKQIEKN